jgi:hypothetical protein
MDGMAGNAFNTNSTTIPNWFPPPQCNVNVQ